MKKKPAAKKTVLPYHLGGSNDPHFQDHGGNIIPDRIKANQDYYEASENYFDRGDLIDEGRNPDGSGESYAERNV